MTPALNTEQQDKILAMVKNTIQARERVKTLVKAGGVSEARYRATTKEQFDRFRDFLKEL